MNAVTENAIQIVRDYEDHLEFIFECRGYTIEQRSYTRWVVSELLCQLEKDSTIPPLIVMENLRDKLFNFSNMNKKGRLAFTVSHNAVENLIDLLVN